MTKNEIAKIEARANAAKVGPWFYQDGEIGNRITKRRGLDANVVWVMTHEGGGIHDNEDGIFMAKARTDIPKLIKKIRRLEKDNRNLTKEIEQMYRDAMGGAI